MPSSSDSPAIFHLTPPASAERLRELRSEVTAALAAGADRLVIDVDALPKLDSPVIATLIAILREAREAGVPVALAAGRQALLDTLRITALDRIFEVVGPVEVVPPPLDPPETPAPRRRPAVRFATALAGALMVFGAFGAQSAAEEALPPSTIVRHVIEQNPDLRSYQARVHVQLQLQTFPYIAPHLDGTTYFKRPNNFEVVFDRVPSYANGFERLYSDIGDPTSWDRRFTMTFAGEKQLGAHRDLVIRLVQKVRGMIDHQDVAVDPTTWHIDEMEWHYYNGGTISMNQEFGRSGDWNVLTAQHATIRIPHVHAVAEAHYSDYHTNVAIDETVFTKKSK